MARDLKLKVERIDDDRKVRVSWIDLQKLTQQTMLFIFIIISNIGIGVLFTATGVKTPVDEGALVPFFVGVILLFHVLFLPFYKIQKPNSVTFAPDTIHHNGKYFKTDYVTRFDYGRKSALTGAQNLNDPHLIRMWLNDAAPYTISENTWQLQVCHEIRHALDEALVTVRKAAVEDEQAATYGPQDDKGMPDY